MWVEVETYAQLAAAVGEGPFVSATMSANGSWGYYQAYSKLSQASRRRAEGGHRIGARTKVIALPEAARALFDRRPASDLSEVIEADRRSRGRHAAEAGMAR